MNIRLTIVLFVVLFITVGIVEGKPKRKRMFINYIFTNCIVISITVSELSE